MRGGAGARVTDPGAVFAALSDPTRRQVVERLAQEGTITATEVAGDLPVTRQAVAKHLTALAEAGLVSSSREGRETRYRLTPEPLGDAMSWMAAVGGRWDERLAALRDHVARRR
jgi:DNA-binding transcriptional ArsR family regulator